ncbi:hypothetical protein ACFWGC_26535 [Cytobacillus pseudoceanisediminis]|uniref:hypothetical protein n=1 Tax=Cytobacillus pseudoceanisediminis TaxID=3051614 RepID=UPI00365FB5F2
MSNFQKISLIELLKKEGVYVRYCSEQGYIYELVKSIPGQVTRYLFGIKNGELRVLLKDTAFGQAA